MSDNKFLLIKRLNTTVPEAFVHIDMRPVFRELVNICQIPQRLSSYDFVVPPDSDRGLKPIAFNLMNDALEAKDGDLLKRLQAHSYKVGYWFFNVFVIPDSYNGITIIGNPRFGVIKDVTKGLDKFVNLNPLLNH